MYVFYISRVTGRSRQRIFLPGGKNKIAFIRAEYHDTDNLMEAMDDATPQIGESVMNSHSLDKL